MNIFSVFETMEANGSSLGDHLTREEEDRLFLRDVLNAVPEMPSHCTDSAVLSALEHVHELIKGHSNVIGAFAGTQLTNQKWTGVPAIVVVVTKKAVIPTGEAPFPPLFREVCVDVIEGCLSLL